MRRFGSHVRQGVSMVGSPARRLAKIGAVLVVAAGAVLGFAAPASAHVTVTPTTATQGGYATLTFRVPNEKDDAKTTQLEIAFPTQTPIASASIKPVPGWTAELERTTLDTPVPGAHGAMVSDIVSRVVWTAEPSAQLGQNQFQEFSISVGPLPEVDQLIFKALQHYSDGDTVAWIDEPTEGVELEHPAPIVHLTPATDGTDNAAAGDDAAGSSDDSNGAAVGLGVAGAVLGLAGLIVGLLAYRRTTAR